MTSVTDPLSRATTYAYDADSNPVRVTTPRGSTTRTYASRGPVIRIGYSDTRPLVALGPDDSGRTPPSRRGDRRGLRLQLGRRPHQHPRLRLYLPGNRCTSRRAPGDRGVAAARGLVCAYCPVPA
ncbi:RHS repeat domain-containing protein [Kitasatospora cinereorecta]|uniref:RHS repeat domain-containing protein n=1 Tax=Streptomyces sp. NPDC025273 TaxID=3155251 RepID=UPI00340EF35D